MFAVSLIVLTMLAVSIRRGWELQERPEPSEEWFWELRTFASTAWIVLAGFAILFLIPDSDTIPIPSGPGWMIGLILVGCVIAGLTAAFLRLVGIWAGFEIRRRKTTRQGEQAGDGDA